MKRRNFIQAIIATFGGTALASAFAQKTGSRKANISIAQMLDRGETLNAQIEQLQYSYNSWKRVG